MLDRKLLEDGERKLEADLRKLISKAELTPADYDAFKKAMCIAGMIANYPGGMMDEEGMAYGYPASYIGSNYRGYSADPMMGGIPNHGMYGNDANMSNGRMRSPVTGRYISNGYSGHSIEDRMIMALEQQMDEAKTDYERQLVEKEIQRLRRGDR